MLRSLNELFLTKTKTNVHCEGNFNVEILYFIGHCVRLGFHFFLLLSNKSFRRTNFQNYERRR